MSDPWQICKDNYLQGNRYALSAYPNVDRVTLDAIIRANKAGLNNMEIIGAVVNTNASSDHNILLVHGA